MTGAPDVLPSKANDETRSVFISKFWLVPETHDMSLVNCRYETKNVDIALGAGKVTLSIPYVCNFKPLEKEALIWVEKPTTAIVVEAPPGKKSKLSHGQPKAKGKAKAEAKGK